MEELIQQPAIPEPSATPLERLKYLLSLSRKSQAAFSRLLDIDPSSMSRLLTGRLPITKAFVNRIVANLGVSKEWFVNGIGVPFPKSDQTKVITADTQDLRLSSAKGAPVYDIDATAGCTSLSRMFTTENIIGYLDIPQIKPEFPVVRVSGNSMTPRIPNGSYISIREIRDISIIMWGATYLVELEDYRMVKIVRKHPNDPTKIILHSENPEYDDIEIPRSSVVKLFIVETIINCQTIA